MKSPGALLLNKANLVITELQTIDKHTSGEKSLQSDLRRKVKTIVEVKTK